MQIGREGGREPVAENRWMEDETFRQSLRNAEMLQAVEDNARACCRDVETEVISHSRNKIL